MAHKIDFSKGKAAYFGVKEPAWHGLGTTVETAKTAEEAIVLAGLDFEVKKYPIYAGIPIQPTSKGELTYEDKELSPIELEKKFATVRTDVYKPLGVVGNRYEVVQNKNLFSFFDAVVGEGEAIYETAGSLDGGRTVWIMAKLPSYISVQGKEEIEKFLLLVGNHDGTASIYGGLTPVRVVCMNTCAFALKTMVNKVTIRHTASAHENLIEAHKLLGISNKLSDELGLVFDKMSKTYIKDQQVGSYIADIFMTKEEKAAWKENKQTEQISTRKRNILADVYRYYHEGAGQDLVTAKGTVFGAYNAITGYYQNVKDYKQLESKMSSNLMGSNYTTMTKAFTKALELCTN